MSAKDLSRAHGSHLPPAQPTYILRGHTAQIHSVQFFRQNLRLLTGDADGWVICWDVPSKRPVAVWRPHGPGSTVLGLGKWGEKVITHGRDNKLKVWQLRAEDETGLERVLPVDDASSERRSPWLLYSLDVNALNFCSFGMCLASPPPSTGPTSTTPTSGEPAHEEGILIAIPGLQDGMINITALPAEDRIATIPSPPGVSTGMLMAVGLHYSTTSNPTSASPRLQVLAGYESGHVALWTQSPSTTSPAAPTWQTIYLQKPHAQPVLSLSPAPSLGYWYSSSADAVIARHPLHPSPSPSHPSPTLMKTKHAGQQSLKVRSDGKIFATAGWDGRVRVYEAKEMREMAVLKWHKEGVYGVDFAHVGDSGGGEVEGAMEERRLTVAEQRTMKAKGTHWLAAGSKDGKVSLWDIY